MYHANYKSSHGIYLEIVFISFLFFSFFSPNVSKECLDKLGTCILFSVFDHDTIGRDDFAGEIIVHMSTILKIGIDKSMDRMPAMIMPLKRPKRPVDGPYVVSFKVLLQMSIQAGKARAQKQ
jgi:hypothetical protein